MTSTNITFKEIEHIDDFDETTIFWVDIAGQSVPEHIKKQAQAIDKENYDKDCFGVCIQHNYQTGKTYVIQNEDGEELYYIDNKGDKHWFAYELSELERNDFCQKCINYLTRK